jgi:hypothetical protein
MARVSIAMAETVFEVQLNRMRSRIEPLEKLVHALAGSLPAPLLYHSGQQHYGVRFGKPDVRHFCLLKAVRVVSALNAAIALARGGYTQEIGVLMRTLIECTTHIEFVLDSHDDAGALEPAVEKYVQDYFSDFARNSSADFKRAQVQQRTVNKRLGDTLDNIARLSGDEGERVPAEQRYSNIYLTYSNYVHAKYPEVMDLYGGNPGHFHLHGMLATPKDDESLQTIDAFIDTACITFRLMVSQLRLHHLVEADAVLREWFGAS